MLYSEFKSQFREDESEYTGEYKVDDARNFPHEKTTAHEEKTPKAKSKSRKVFKYTFVSILVVILLISATLLYFELFTDNGIYTLFSKIAHRADYYYCLSSGRFDTLDEAKANSDNAKSRGGAGYIFYDGGYNVLISIYLDAKTAESVAEKHGYTVFKIFKSTPLKGLPPTLLGDYDKCQNFEAELIEQLYEASAMIENNLDKASATSSISKAIALAKSKTSGFLEKSENSQLLAVQKYSTQIKQVLSEAEKLESQFTLSSLRQTMIFIAIVMA